MAEFFNALMSGSGSGGASTEEFNNTLDMYENTNRCKVFFLSHKAEKNSTFGIALGTKSGVSTSEAMGVINFFNGLENEDIEVHMILNTTGGDLDGSEVISKAIERHKGRVKVFIPNFAMDDAFLIALHADEIYMTSNSFMTPVDIRYWGFPASTIMTYGEMHQDREGFIDSVIRLAAVNIQLKFDRISEIIRNALNSKMSEEMIQALIDRFASGKSVAGKPLFYEELIEYIPFISNEFPARVLDLHRMYKPK